MSRTKSSSVRNELITEIHDCDIDYENREIFVHSDEDITNVVSTKFIKNIRLLDNANDKLPILIHFNTCGGEWDYGMGMYDAIKSCVSPTIALCYSCARSMSSIIPQAASHRIIMPNAYFMIHNGTVSIESTSKSASSFTQFNDSLTKIMLDIYVNSCRFGINFKNYSDTKIRKFLQDKMNKFEEWYMSARDSVNYGFMDAVLGDKGYENIPQLKLLN